MPCDVHHPARTLLLLLLLLLITIIMDILLIIFIVIIFGAGSVREFVWPPTLTVAVPNTSHTGVCAKSPPALKNRLRGLVSELGREDLMSSTKHMLKTWYADSCACKRNTSPRNMTSSWFRHPHTSTSKSTCAHHFTTSHILV